MMDNCKRRFLQLMMSQNLLSKDKMLDAYKSCCLQYQLPVPDGVATQEEHLKETVRIINNNIAPFGMEIKRGKDEMEGKMFYGMINTTESSITLCASQYTDNELEFFKKLIELLVMSDTGTVGSITAIDITNSLAKKMTKSNAEDLLDRLQNDQWIGKTIEGKLYLSCRGTMELEQHIFNIYADIALRCRMCNQLCLQGEKCGSCDEVKLHNHCAKRLFNKPYVDKMCPSCHQSWEGTDESADVQPSTSRESPNDSGPTTPMSRGRKRKATK